MTEPKSSMASMAPRPKGCPFSYDATNCIPMDCGEWCKLWISDSGVCTFTWLAEKMQGVATALEQIAKTP
jgi:hypothetical protein